MNDEVERLRQQARLDSSGAFTIDWRQAQHKLRQYLSSDSTAYLCRLARAAVQSDSSLDVRSSGSRLLAYSPALLADPGDLRELGQRSLQAQPLAQAVLLALDLKPSRLEVSLAGPDSVTALRYANGEVEIVTSAASERRGTSFALYRSGPRPEIQRLRSAMTFAPVPITIGGKLVQPQLGRKPRPGPLDLASEARLVGLRPRPGSPAQFFWADHAILQWRLQDEVEAQNGVGLRHPPRSSIVLENGRPDIHQGLSRHTAVFAQYLGNPPANLSLVVWGETLERLEMPDWPTGLQAIVDASHLTLDLGGDRIVEDEARQALLTWVQNQSAELSNLLHRRYPGVTNEDYRASLAFDRAWHRH